MQGEQMSADATRQGGKVYASYIFPCFSWHLLYQHILSLFHILSSLQAEIVILCYFLHTGETTKKESMRIPVFAGFACFLLTPTLKFGVSHVLLGSRWTPANKEQALAFFIRRRR
jgi:hypothetical protein